MGLFILNKNLFKILFFGEKKGKFSVKESEYFYWLFLF